MIVILYECVFLAILFSPGILIAIAPRRCVRLVTAATVLPVGLLALDEHVSTVAPYDDDGPFSGIGTAIVMTMCVAAVLGILKRPFDILHDDPDEPRYPVDRAWPVPVGVLAAAYFLHWLSNRLAGAEQPLTLHLAITVSGVVIGFAASLAAKLFPPIRDPSLLLAAFAFALVGMIVNNAAKGCALWRQAKQEAGNQPHCIMSYGGFERRRFARDGWDLSPLVNRHHATWAASKAPVIVIAEPRGVKQLRWMNGEFLNGELGAAPCDPA